MLTAVLAFAALLAFLAATTLYVFTHAAIGRAFGVGVRGISVGFGPSLFRRTISGCEYKLGILPLGGNTRYFGDDDIATSPVEVSWKRLSEVSPLGRAVIGASGPVVNLVFGLFLLGLPIWVGADRVVATTPEESNVSPRAVPGLAIETATTSWASQWRLFRDTGLEYFIRIASFRSLSEWGGQFGYFVTCGSLGSRSLWAWVTAIGVLFLMNGAVNLLPIPVPIPVLNGFHVVVGLVEFFVGWRLPDRWRFNATLIGLLVVLFAYGRILWTDITWMIAQFK